MAPMSREAAARLSYAELEAAGVCDCGADLATHPKLGKPAPLSRWATNPSSWAYINSARASFERRNRERGFGK